MPKILVVDDEPLIAMLVSDWLAEQGYEIAGPAHSVDHALSIVESTEIDAAVLDVTLGDQDCYEIAAVLSGRNIPFAFATGHGAGSVDPRFQDRVTVAKPFDFEGVRAAVVLLLGEAASA